MIKFAIITPTLLRQELLTNCESVDAQQYKELIHIVVIDRELRSLSEGEKQMLKNIEQPYRKFFFTGKKEPKNDYGNLARHLAYECLPATIDYILHLDDDDMFHVDGALEILNKAISNNKKSVPFYYFPCMRAGSVFFNRPPGKCRTVTCQYAYKPVINGKRMQWPADGDYLSDGDFLEYILKSTKEIAAINSEPLTRVDYISGGQFEVTSFEQFSANGNKLNCDVKPDVKQDVNPKITITSRLPRVPIISLPSIPERRDRVDKVLANIREKAGTEYKILLYENPRIGTIPAMFGTIDPLRDDELLIMFNDDFFAETDDFLRKMLIEFEKNFGKTGDGVIQANDMHQNGALATIPLATVGYYKKYFYRGYKSFFVDQELKLIAENKNQFIYCSEIKIEHRHWSFGQCEQDELAKLHFSENWNRDAEIFNQRCKDSKNFSDLTKINLNKI